MALVGELGEPTDDSVTQVTSIILGLFQGCSHARRHGKLFQQLLHPRALGSQ